MAKIEFENVKLNKVKVNKVRDNKAATGVPISTFIEKLIDAELPDNPVGILNYQLIKGQLVYFKNDTLPFDVKAVSKRYAVCSRKLNRSNDADLIKNRVDMGAYASFTDAYNALKKEPVYTIVDFRENKRSPNDRVFNSYDYFNETDCAQTIIDLMDGIINLSKRNEADLDIDWSKTKSS